MFKIIIAGSRTFNDYELLRTKCDNILQNIKEEICIVSGTANGADRLGERYAQERGYYLLECPAPWGEIEGKPARQIRVNSTGKPYWTLAGQHRNEQMAREADALIAFNLGTNGTQDMITRAKNHGLKIREIDLLN